MRIRLTIPLVLVLWFLHICNSQTREIIGYYPSWKWNLRDNPMSPDKIPFDKLTMINYAFFYPLPDGRLVGRDTVGDAMILRGLPRPGELSPKSNDGLVGLSHRHRVKVLLSVGGWEDSGNFSEVAGTEAGRIRFAHSCLQQIRTYGFDGIDIDWEYPGYADHRGRPVDKENFTLLLRVLKDSLDNFGDLMQRRYLLTAAFPANGSVMANYDMESIAVLLDELNIMTYDFCGPWDSLSGHNAPLYAPSEADSLRNVDAAFKLFTHTLKVPSEKINLGVPFYGHSFTNCTSLFSRHSGADTLHFSKEGMFYYDVVPLLGECTRTWDDKAKVPYLICNSWKTLISYDDPESIGYKARYVLDNRARGLIIWEITGDYLHDGTTPLLDVISSTFKGSRAK